MILRDLTSFLTEVQITFNLESARHTLMIKLTLFSSSIPKWQCSTVAGEVSTSVHHFVKATSVEVRGWYETLLSSFGSRAEFSDRSWSSKGAFVDAAADEVVASSPVATAHIHRRSRKRKPRLLCRRCARSFGVPSILLISMYAYLIWITEIIDFCTLIQTSIFLGRNSFSVN